MRDPERGHPGEPGVVLHFQVVGVPGRGRGERVLQHLERARGQHLGAVLRRLARHRHRAARCARAHLRTWRFGATETT